jgi:hypothetical protein
VLYSEIEKATKHVAIRHGYILYRSHIEPGGNALLTMVRRGSTDIRAAYPLDGIDRSEILSAHLDGRRMEPILDRLMFGDDSGSWHPDGDAVPRPLQKIKQIALSVFAGSLLQRGLYLSTETHIRLCPFGVSVHAKPTPALAIELAEPFIRRIRGMPPGERYGAVYAEAERQAESVLLRKDVRSRWRPPAMIVWFR